MSFWNGKSAKQCSYYYLRYSKQKRIWRLQSKNSLMITWIIVCMPFGALNIMCCFWFWWRQTRFSGGYRITHKRKTDDGNLINYRCKIQMQEMCFHKHFKYWVFPKKGIKIKLNEKTRHFNMQFCLILPQLQHFWISLLSLLVG